MIYFSHQIEKSSQKINDSLPVKFPTGISNLATGLTNVDRDTLTLKKK
jgi:hypothetical protein